MSFRSGQVVTLVVALLAGSWIVWATLGIAERLGVGPPVSVLVSLVVGALAAALVAALLHDGPRPLPLVLRVRDRRGRR